jgi:hypothetical protein
MVEEVKVRTITNARARTEQEPTNDHSDNDEDLHRISIRADHTLPNGIRRWQGDNADDITEETFTFLLGYVGKVFGDILRHEMCPDRTSYHRCDVKNQQRVEKRRRIEQIGTEETRSR